MKLLTLTQAGAELGVSPSTLRSQVRNGRLRATLVGKTYVITTRELERYRRESLGNAGRPKGAGHPRFSEIRGPVTTERRARIDAIKRQMEADERRAER